MKKKLREKNPGKEAVFAYCACLYGCLCALQFFGSRGRVPETAVLSFNQPILSAFMGVADGWDVVLLAVALGFEGKCVFF